MLQFNQLQDFNLLITGIIIELKLLHITVDLHVQTTTLGILLHNMVKYNIFELYTTNNLHNLFRKNSIFWRNSLPSGPVILPTEDKFFKSKVRGQSRNIDNRNLWRFNLKIKLPKRFTIIRENMVFLLTTIKEKIIKYTRNYSVSTK